MVIEAGVAVMVDNKAAYDWNNPLSNMLLGT
jgi:hypothetical protein